MKYNGSMQLVGMTLSTMIRRRIPQKNVRKQILQEYRRILETAGDIGSRNRLLSSYLLAAFFIAMNRKDGLTPEENIAVLETSMRKSRALKLFMGDSRRYFSEKNMESRRQWSRQTKDPAHRKAYPNDWVVEVLEQTEDYRFGFDYRECGALKLCRDQGCPELARYLCRLDYMLTEIMGVKLLRTQVLAEGGDCCDFRFLGISVCIYPQIPGWDLGFGQRK